MKPRTRRIKKRADPVATRAHEIGIPAAQIRPGRFELHDVSNHTEGDQRRMVRSGERQTIRRKPKVAQLYDRGIIGRRELAACEWYAAAYSLRYDTLGITADYEKVGGRGSTSFDHCAKTRIQAEALHELEQAREAISPHLIRMFESVVLQGKPLRNLKISFRLAAKQLLQAIEGRVHL